MNCRRARNLVYELVDGVANESTRVELERHFGQCTECEGLADQLRRSMALLQRAPVETLDESFNWKVRLAIHKERNATRESLASQGAVFRSWNLRYAASAAAGFVVAVAVAWFAVGNGVGGWTETTPTLSERGAARQESPSGNVAARPQSPFMNASPASPVSEGIHGPFRRTTQREGAITSSDAGMDLDSLVQAQTLGMSEEERIQYLQKRIEFMNRYLQQCREKAHR